MKIKPNKHSPMDTRVRQAIKYAESAGPIGIVIRETLDPEWAEQRRMKLAAYQSPEPEMPKGNRLSIALCNEAKDDPTRSAVYEWAANWADALEKASKACAKQMVDRGCWCPELLDLASALRRPKAGKRGAR